MTEPHQTRAPQAETELVPLVETSTPQAFDVVFRGYERVQVDRQIAWLEGLVAAREIQVTETETRAKRARGRGRSSCGAAWPRWRPSSRNGRPSYEAIGGRIGQMLQLADQEAAAIKQNARDASVSLERRTAELEALAQKQRDQRTKEADDRIRTRLEQAKTESDRLLSSSKERSPRRAHKTSDAMLAQAKERSEAMVGQARQHAQSIVADAQKQVAALTGQRDAIHTQLQQLREHLARATGLQAAPVRPSRPERPSCSGRRLDAGPRRVLDGPTVRPRSRVGRARSATVPWVAGPTLGSGTHPFMPPVQVSPDLRRFSMPHAAASRSASERARRHAPLRRAAVAAAVVALLPLVGVRRVQQAGLVQGRTGPQDERAAACSPRTRSPPAASTRSRPTCRRSRPTSPT